MSDTTIAHTQLCGFPLAITTDIACDMHQGLFAVGLANKTVKMYVDGGSG